MGIILMSLEVDAAFGAPGELDPAELLLVASIQQLDELSLQGLVENLSENDSSSRGVMRVISLLAGDGAVAAINAGVRWLSLA